jgi:hypothetical protein
MAWNAKTLANTLITVALEIILGILSAMTNHSFMPRQTEYTLL